MSSNYKSSSMIIRQKLFRIIDIFIEFMVGIFLSFMEREDWYLKYATVAKFISTAIFNAMNWFHIRFHCYCLSKQSIQEDLIKDEKMEILIDEKLKKLRLKKAILLRFLNERNTSNPKYLDMISKVRQIEILKKEIKDKIEIILAKLFIIIDYLYRLTFDYIL